MKINQSVCLFAAGAALLATAGCANKLVFATNTSLGLDISGTSEIPNRISLAYSRQELALVPRKDNGEPHSVFGKMQGDIDFIKGSKIGQVFATGHAALNAAQHLDSETNSIENPAPDVLNHEELPNRDLVQDESLRSYSTNYSGTANNLSLFSILQIFRSSNKEKSLIFTTASDFGLKISSGNAQIQPSVLLGYRRSEATYIPIINGKSEADSVYADILIDSRVPVQNHNISNLEEKAPYGTKMKQVFATGRAAIILSSKKVVTEKLQRIIESSSDSESNEEILKARIFNELAYLPNSKFEDIILALKDNKVIYVNEFDLISSETLINQYQSLRDLAERLRITRDIPRLTTYLAQLEKVNNNR